MADIALIERVVSNLIENAIQYTEENGFVRIILGPGDNRVKISIADSGPGIDEEDLPYIFDRFYRAEISRTKDNGGTGLELAIVKAILKLHNQEIYVRNRDAQGAEFYFWLPAD